MIPKDYITAWRTHAPWRQDAQVEQDLVISRAIVEMFRIALEVRMRSAFEQPLAVAKPDPTPTPTPQATAVG